MNDQNMEPVKPCLLLIVSLNRAVVGRDLKLEAETSVSGTLSRLLYRWRLVTAPPSKYPEPVSHQEFILLMSGKAVQSEL